MPQPLSRSTTVLDYLYAPETLTVEAVFEEVLHLAAHGEHPQNIPTRVGLTRAYLYDAARRYNRPDIHQAIGLEQ